mgnify:CR=1 FL=1
MKTEKIIIGDSDYSRKQIESRESDGGWGDSARDVLKTIREYENNGYEVKFETSLFRKIFCMGIYRVVAYKKQNKVSDHCPLCNSSKIERTTFSEYSYCCLDCDAYWVN